MDPIYSLGLQIIHTLQTLSPGLDGLMKTISILGTIEFYMILIPLIYWLIDVQLGFRLLMVIVAANFLNDYFKVLFHQPRPYWIDQARPIATETSYGIPSGHANGSMTAFGYLAHRVSRTWMWIVSFVLVLLIGISRLYLGVHFLQDVLAGWALAAFVIFLFVKSEGKFLAWLKQYPAGYQILAGFLVSLVMILIGLVIYSLFAAVSDPTAWASFSGQARSLTGYFTLGGALFGGVAGYVLMKEHAAFQEKGSWLELLGRYVVGIVGVLIFYLGLDFLFNQLAIDESTGGYILRYARYAIVAFWATFGAPWVFLRVGLATPRVEIPVVMPVPSPR